MKETEVICKVDARGKITIPINIIGAMGIEPGDMFKAYISGRTICYELCESIFDEIQKIINKYTNISRRNGVYFKASMSFIDFDSFPFAITFKRQDTKDITIFFGCDNLIVRDAFETDLNLLMEKEK